MEFTPSQIALAAVAIAALASIIGAVLGNAAGFRQAFVYASKLLATIQTAVIAAESLYGATDEEKYRRVAEAAALTANDLGLPIDADFIQLLIEGVVKLYHRQQGTVYSGPKQ